MVARNTTLVPRNGHTLVVGIVARISGCQDQKELSLDDQIDHAKQVVAELYSGPVEYRIIATKGKGERLDRPELKELEELLRMGILDLLIVEDIGRLVRGATALLLCGIAVDHGTRVLAPNDCIDTADDSWEEDVLSACRDHVGHNAHTSKRLKQKLMNRFVKGLGATPCETYGYIKPPEAKTFDDWAKDPAAEAIFQEWLQILKTTLNCSAVADWLNKNKVPTGKYCRCDTWDGVMVRRLTANPILKGMPARGTKRTVKRHGTGRRISVRNPDGPKYRECPHLAFWSPEDFDAINAQLEAKNAPFKRRFLNGADPRCGVPRKRTTFPGQYARCTYCGRIVVWGGNGATENLMCSGSRRYLCWNSIAFEGPLAARLILEAITAELYRLDGFDGQFREMVRAAAQPGGADLARRWDMLKRDEETQTHKRKNLADSMAVYGPQAVIEEALVTLTATDAALAQERRALEGMKNRVLTLPASVQELRGLVEQQFQALAVDSSEFGDLLRQVVPAFHIQLVRLCDGGHPLPQARVTLALGGLVPDMKHAPDVEQTLTRELTLNLFEPPQRERIRVQAVQLSGEGLTARKIASRLSENVTDTAVQNALALDRKMRELSLETPYVLVTEPPDDYPKLRRHKNPKYRWEPLEGYPKLPG